MLQRVYFHTITWREKDGKSDSTETERGDRERERESEREQPNTRHIFYSSCPLGITVCCLVDKKRSCPPADVTALFSLSSCTTTYMSNNPKKQNKITCGQFSKFGSLFRSPKQHGALTKMTLNPQTLNPTLS